MSIFAGRSDAKYCGAHEIRDFDEKFASLITNLASQFMNYASQIMNFASHVMNCASCVKNFRIKGHEFRNLDAKLASRDHEFRVIGNEFRDCDAKFASSGLKAKLTVTDM